ncbi:RNA polymerase sigma-70 factor (ECF subfamily) [Sinomonas atrocyanea]|uniref:RNA polymerase sigma factor n=1 Tax=Sinomonas atrocyanea TaxID=37927 RepID=UPI002781178D|nr:sigma-70 family RNA polymerase sigma factor [Sinomonas atrocyanea]MDP9884020.1 RNA polymerase sigma-70 factor (ECF subfamily) [Sinomonas atrocyanea]
MAEAEDARTVAAVFREEYGRAVSVLMRTTGDLGLAEDAVQEAFAAAAQRWPADGVPEHPGAWIITTARRRAVDRFRREAARGSKEAAAADLADDAPRSEPFGDDRLALLFVCCHPALAMPARVALALRVIGGLTTAQIAAAFLVTEATLAQRISRAKAKIRDARIPYRIPAAEELPERLAGVLAVIYLIYNEGYSAGLGEPPARAGLCAEAVRLARVLVRLLPHEPEATGLLALLLLSESRRNARSGPGGVLVPLAEQDRSHWDGVLIAEGTALVRECLARGRLGQYQLQAAIQAEHAAAASSEATDWRRIVRLYDLLAEVAPGPVVQLNRAVAVAEAQGPAAALALVDGLGLAGYHVYHAVRADLLARTGRAAEAAAEYAEAAQLAPSAGERSYLEERGHRLAGA